VRQPDRRHERRVPDPDTVVNLVSLLESAQDRDRVLDRRLVHVDRLETALQRGILLDVLLVLGERRRSDRAQLAAGERRLQHVRGVHRAFRRPGPDDRVELVDEQDDRAFRLLDLLQHGFQPVLELAAVLGARDHRAQIERDEAFVLQALGDVAHVNAAREPFDDRGLADSGFTDQNRVVLRAAGEDLDDPPDLLVAPDHGIDLSAAGQVRQVPRIALERLVLVLGIGVGHA
jgi:hypothetical protein